VDALFKAALANDDPGALLLPHLLPDDWQPDLALRLSSHRGGLVRGAEWEAFRGDQSPA